MKIFITKGVGEVTESVSVSGIKDVKDIIDLYKCVSGVANAGTPLGEVSDEASVLISGGVLQLTNVDITPYYRSISEFKSCYKDRLGDDVVCFGVGSRSVGLFELTIDDMKLIYKEFGEIIKFWEE